MNKGQTVYLPGVRVGIGAVLVIALALIMNEPEVEPLVQSSQPQPTIIVSSDSATKQDTSSAMLKSDDLAPSLAGTHHGVQLRSHNQSLIITASLKDLFDYYLSAAGEDSLEKIRDRVSKDLAKQLRGNALEQALEIWNNYLAYKGELVQFDQQFQATSARPDKLQHLQVLQQRQLALLALQDQILGANTAAILFAFDRQLDNYTLAKAELLASDLSAEQIQQRLINLSAQLPIATVQNLGRNEKQKQLMLIDQNEYLTEQQKYHLRVNQVGAAAASRLQKLDEGRRLWQQRIYDFIQQKEQLADASLAVEEYQSSLDKLYNQHFTPAEQLRARALTANRE
jgi:lipase chaperone LimK